MGLDLQAIRLLDQYTKSKKLGNVLTLGRQGLSLGQSEIQIAAKKYGISSALLESEWCEQLLIKHFGANSVNSLDCSNFEEATLVHDLNEPVKSEVQYDTVLDFGTSEHIYNIKIVYENIKNLCKKDGGIIHLLPANNFCGHGFYQFSPMFFRSIYAESSGFFLRDMYLSKMSKDFNWYQVDLVSQNDRFVFHNTYPTTIMVVVIKGEKIKSVSVQQPDYKNNWDGNISSGVNKSRNTTLRRLKHFMLRNGFLKYYKLLEALFKIIYPYHGYSCRLEKSPYVKKIR